METIEFHFPRILFPRFLPFFLSSVPSSLSVVEVSRNGSLARFEKYGHCSSKESQDDPNVFSGQAIKDEVLYFIKRTRRILTVHLAGRLRGMHRSFLFQLLFFSSPFFHSISLHFRASPSSTSSPFSFTFVQSSFAFPV